MAGAVLAWNNNEGMLPFWPVGDLVELADGPTEYGEVARDGCLAACDKVNCTYTGGEKTADQT